VYNQLFSALSKKYRKFVIVEDFNAHHSWWGCCYDDSFGKILSHAIDTHRLIILNDRSSPTLLYPTAKHSTTDLVLTSENIAMYCNSNVGLGTLGSDHFPIFTSIEGNFRLRSVFLYKLKASSKDLAILYHSLYSSLDKLKSILSNNYLLAYASVEQHIRKQLYSLFPSKSCLPRSCALRPRLPTPPWWNEKCQEAIRVRREAIRTYFKHPSPDNFEAHKRARLRCSKILKRQKRLGWQKYCSQLNHKTPTSEVWSLIKSFKRRKMVKPSSTLLPDTSAQAHLIKDTIDKLCPPSCRHLEWRSLRLMEDKDEQLDNVTMNLGNLLSKLNCILPLNV